MRVLGLCVIVSHVCSVASNADASRELQDAAQDTSSKVGKAKQAIQKGADINAQHPGSKQTPLMAATLSGHTKMVKYLLGKGADTTIPEKDGYTPMHGAGFQGRAEIAKLLVAHGLDPLDLHTDGFAGIHRACWGNEQRHADTVKAFLEAGVPIDFKAGNGKPLLELTSNLATQEVLKQWAAGKTDL
jgi:ankyrin repeat protein